MQTRQVLSPQTGKVFLHGSDLVIGDDVVLEREERQERDKQKLKLEDQDKQTHQGYTVVGGQASGQSFDGGVDQLVDKIINSCPLVTGNSFY